MRSVKRMLESVWPGSYSSNEGSRYVSSLPSRLAFPSSLSGSAGQVRSDSSYSDCFMEQHIIKYTTSDTLLPYSLRNSLFRFDTRLSQILLSASALDGRSHRELSVHLLPRRNEVDSRRRTTIDSRFARSTYSNSLSLKVCSSFLLSLLHNFSADSLHPCLFRFSAGLRLHPSRSIFAVSRFAPSPLLRDVPSLFYSQSLVNASQHSINSNKRDF